MDWKKYYMPDWLLLIYDTPGPLRSPRLRAAASWQGLRSEMPVLRSRRASLRIHRSRYLRNKPAEWYHPSWTWSATKWQAMPEIQQVDIHRKSCQSGTTPDSRSHRLEAKTVIYVQIRGVFPVPHHRKNLQMLPRQTFLFPPPSYVRLSQTLRQIPVSPKALWLQHVAAPAPLPRYTALWDGLQMSVFPSLYDRQKSSDTENSLQADQYLRQHNRPRADTQFLSLQTSAIHR